MLPVDLQILKYIFFEKPIYYFKIKPYLKWDMHHKLENQLESFKQVPNIGDQKLQELDYTIFDLETTGFIPEIGHEIISIGAIRVHGIGSCHTETFYQVIRPIRPVNNQTLRLTGLTREQLRNGCSFIEGFQSFIEFCQGSVLVAHPAKFDMRFLQALLKRWKLPNFNPAVLDSQKMAQWLFPSVKHQLDPLLKHFGIEKRERHHALNDAIMTAEMFNYMLIMTLERDVQTLQQLQKVLDHTKKAKKPF